MSRKKVARRWPVTNGVELQWRGETTRDVPYPGPVSGNGYQAIPGEPVMVEKRDVKAMLATEMWSRARRPVKKAEKQEA